MVVGDPFLLRDMIDNLIDNAIRYSPPSTKVTVSCSTQAGISSFAVEDSGPGVPLSERQNIFNRFYRLNKQNMGSGLGLAIVQHIVTVHRATIRIDTSAATGGSIFSVDF